MDAPAVAKGGSLEAPRLRSASVGATCTTGSIESRGASIRVVCAAFVLLRRTAFDRPGRFMKAHPKTPAGAGWSVWGTSS